MSFAETFSIFMVIMMLFTLMSTPGSGQVTINFNNQPTIDHPTSELADADSKIEALQYQRSVACPDNWFFGYGVGFLTGVIFYSIAAGAVSAAIKKRVDKKIAKMKEDGL